MTRRSAFALVTILSFSLHSYSQENETYFSERRQSACQNSDPEFTAWFFGQTRELPRIMQILGPVRDQGPSGQCYALTAADLITAKTGVRVSGEQVAYLYYKNSTIGRLQSFFGSNDGGFTATAIGATEGQGLCAEYNPVVLRGDPNQNWPGQYCSAPVIRINRLRTKGLNTQGLSAGHQLFPVLDEQLDRKNIVAINYRAQYLYPANVQVSAFNSFANHANSIIARQWNSRSGTCDYVIRNTWGEKCVYSPAMCVRGYYSVPEKLINEALQNIDYIK